MRAAWRRVGAGGTGRSERAHAGRALGRRNVRAPAWLARAAALAGRARRLRTTPSPLHVQAPWAAHGADRSAGVADVASLCARAQADSDVYLAELTDAYTQVGEREAQGVRAQAQARERDEQLAAAGREALSLRQAAERAGAERDAAAAGQRRMEATAGLLQQRAAALEAQLQARARARAPPSLHSSFLWVF